MKNMLISREKVIADGGYPDERCDYNAGALNAALLRLHTISRARHETVNRRLKQFAAVGSRFRHDVHLHSACFHAVANLTQLMIENGEELFQINHLPTQMN